jgi:methyl-accepting chemotaxis protein
MSIGKRLKILNYVLVGTITSLLLFIYLTASNQISLNDSYENRYESYKRANELRNSSDSLTRLARTYVVTNDSRYEKEYWDILAVRNGTMKKKDGTQVSLKKIMENLGFTKEEFTKLKEAENNSNNLVTTETIAMNAIKGLYDNGSGKYILKKEPNPTYAREIMFNKKYHEDKKIITNPVDEFEYMLDQRTSATSNKFKLRGDIFLFIVGGLSVLLGGLIFSTNRNVKKVLEGIVQELDSSVESSTKIADEINSSLIQMSSSSTQQASAAQETSATLNEISAMVSRNLESAQSSNTKAGTSFDLAKEGQMAVTEMLESISDVEKTNSDIMRDVQESNKEISEIVEVIKGISDKTKVINDIVFQTKLLSFNASVEAARAGEHGKGFAVVAEEVGALSQMSGNAANDISQMLSDSIVNVESIVEKTSQNIDRLERNSKEKFSQSVETAKKCETSLNSVVSNVSDVKSMMKEITTASKEQVEGVNNINLAMSEIENGTQVNSRSAQKIEQYSQDLNKDIKTVENLVVNLRSEVLGINNQEVPSNVIEVDFSSDEQSEKSNAA